MAVDLCSVTPWEVERARQRLASLEETWRRFQFVRVHTPSLEKQAATFCELAGEYRRHQHEWSQSRKEMTWLQAEARRLRRALGRWQAWKSPTLLVVIGADAVLGGALLALTADAMFGPTFGRLIFAMGLCMAGLVVAAWFLTRDWTDWQIATLSDRISVVEHGLCQLAMQEHNARAKCEEVRQKWQEEENRHRHMAYLYDLGHNYDRARQEYNDLLAAIQSRPYRLLHQDWRAMRGKPFELFLKEVFEVRGYAVETTKDSGDQGVDLMVSGKGKRIGVQAKGYRGTVGNAAVQQALAGSKFYGCNCCAVVTNSEYTPSAKELARVVGCRLIAGADIPHLIVGRIEL